VARHAWMFATVLLGAFVLLVGAAGCGGQDFSTKDWRGNPFVECQLKDYRQPMVSDLLGNHLNDEMTRSEVRELLGPPDFAETYKGIKGWAYEIGNDDTDCSFVYVGFDKDGRLVKWFDSRSLT